MNWFNKLIQIIGKDLISVTASNTVAAVIGGVFWFIIASFMLAEEYGKLNYYLSIAFVSSTLSLMGLNITVMTFLAKGNEKLRYQANLLVIISNIFVFLLLLIFVNHIPTIFLLIGLSFFVMSWAEILGRKDYKKYSLIVIGQRLLQVFLAILLFFFMGVDGIIIGYSLSALLFSYKFFKSFKGINLQFSEIKQKFSFAMHSYSLAISMTVTLYADKLLIGPLFGFSVLGLYQIGYQFLLLESIIPVSIFQFLLPREASQIENKKILLKGLIISIILSAFGYFFIPTIIMAFFPNFVEAIQSAQIMSLGIIPMTLSAIINSKFLGKEKGKPVLISACSYILTLYGLIIVLGGTYGLIGLAFAVLTSLVIQAAILFVMFKIIEKRSR